MSGADPTYGHMELPWGYRRDPDLGWVVYGEEDSTGAVIATAVDEEDAALITREANEAPKLRERIAELEELVRRAVDHPAVWGQFQSRQYAVAQVFSVGSTTAAKLCRDFEVDPDELRPECRAVAALRALVDYCDPNHVQEEGIDPALTEAHAVLIAIEEESRA